MQFKVVVLDWDGTLVDSERYIVASLREAVAEVGLPLLDDKLYRSIIGLGLKEAFLHLYPSVTAEKLAGLREAYAAAFVAGEHAAIQLFDGVLETLGRLRKEGVQLAVATGKSRRGLERALDASGLRHYFSATRCADETRSKPHPLMLHELMDELRVQPGQMLMVGDTEYDLKMAADCGVPALGVSYGVHSIESLQAHRPLGIVDSFLELPDYVLSTNPNRRITA